MTNQSHLQRIDRHLNFVDRNRHMLGVVGPVLQKLVCCRL